MSLTSKSVCDELIEGTFGIDSDHRGIDTERSGDLGNEGYDGRGLTESIPQRFSRMIENVKSSVTAVEQDPSPIHGAFEDARSG